MWWEQVAGWGTPAPKEEAMETLDYRVVTARVSLEAANDPATLTTEQLREELTLYRKYTRWLVGLADDAADTGYDDAVSQVMLYGGLYIAPADYFKLCPACLKVLDIIWDSGAEQGVVSCSASGATTRS
jgi:hypothetical protein